MHNAFFSPILLTIQDLTNQGFKLVSTIFNEPQARLDYHLMIIPGLEDLKEIRGFIVD